MFTRLRLLSKTIDLTDERLLCSSPGRQNAASPDLSFHLGCSNCITVSLIGVRRIDEEQCCWTPNNRTSKKERSGS